MAIMATDEKQDARNSALELVESVFRMLKIGVEERLNQVDVQKVVNYYNKTHKRKVKFSILFFSFVGSVLFANFAFNFFGEQSFLFSLAVIMGLLLARHTYDESQSTYIYISGLTGVLSIPDDINKSQEEIKKYIENNVFEKSVSIRQKNYFIAGLITLAVVGIGWLLHNPKFLYALPVLGFACFFDELFLKKESRKKRKKGKREK